MDKRGFPNIDWTERDEDYNGRSNTTSVHMFVCVCVCVDYS